MRLIARFSIIQSEPRTGTSQPSMTARAIQASRFYVADNIFLLAFCFLMDMRRSRWSRLLARAVKKTWRCHKGERPFQITGHDGSARVA